MSNWIGPDSGAPQGPLCAYWTDENARMCGHDSCYSIVADQGRDLLTQYASILITEGPAPIPMPDIPGIEELWNVNQPPF